MNETGVTVAWLWPPKCRGRLCIFCSSIVATTIFDLKNFLLSFNLSTGRNGEGKK